MVTFPAIVVLYIGVTEGEGIVKLVESPFYIPGPPSVWAGLCCGRMGGAGLAGAARAWIDLSALAWVECTSS